MNLVLLHFNNSQCVFYGSKPQQQHSQQPTYLKCLLKNLVANSMNDQASSSYLFRLLRFYHFNTRALSQGHCIKSTHSIGGGVLFIPMKTAEFHSDILFCVAHG